MMLSNKLMGGVTAGEDAPEGVDFDGVNDYLSRSTDLATLYNGSLTFSMWFYYIDDNVNPVFIPIYLFNPSGSGYFDVRINTNYDTTQSLDCRVVNDAGGLCSAFYNANSEFGNALNYGWHNLQIVFVNGDASSLKVYLDDRPVSMTNWGNAISGGFSSTRCNIMKDEALNSSSKGRLSNIFLDYTYRDLSIEANRRLFITADRKPTPTATLKALNPILYLPMKDAATAHINEGTGGNFTLNGTIATSGRGANQDNCVASYFDGSADYLSRAAALSGITASKTFTLSFTFNANAGFISGDRLLTFRDSGDLQIFQVSNQSGKLRIIADGTPNTADALVVDAFTIVAGRNYTVQISVDLVDTSKRHVYVNGESFAATWSTYGNIAIAFASASRVAVASNLATSASTLFSGNLGELYFDTKYIDLATSNPFWGSIEGKPIPVRKVIADTGVTPLIAMPLDASNAGKNYGTGGDFTANSAPYVGARGASEFWGNWAKIASAGADYLGRTSTLSGVSASKIFSASFAFTIDSTGSGRDFLSVATAADAARFTIGCSNTDLFRLVAYNSAGTLILNASSATVLAANTTYYVHILVDLANASNRFVYINGVLDSTTWTTYDNDTMAINEARQRFGFGYTFGAMTGKLSEFYFTTDYINFSQEANRLKFRDAFGNPVALLPQIEAGTLPNPAIYMRFDPANFGKNLGTGGDFTINGTITDGGQL